MYPLFLLMQKYINAGTCYNNNPEKQKNISFVHLPEASLYCTATFVICTKELFFLL